MAVVGIDLGTLNSKIGVARRKGIDIITNETSNRATPSLISFGLKQRSIGEPAKTQEISNFKNTIGSLKRLLGRSPNDPEIEQYEKKFINAQLVDAGGSLGVKVNYSGEQHTFSSTQLLAMFLGKLRDTAALELKSPVSDVVIGVPSWYTDIQRRSLIDAAQIASLNPLRIINETTAIALGYGITKSDLPDPETPRHVLFVDAGHSSLTATVVAFAKNQLSVRSSASDRNLGGRDIDFALVQYFAEEFKGKYKIDVLSNPKATFRLIAGCEKLKKVLSANAEANLSVESIMNDVDASSRLTREKMEELIAPLLEKVQAPILQALQDADLKPEQIDSIELVGGTSRVPAFKQRISSIFGGKVLSTTLNQDEAVARGATFACAMLSPVFKVREFSYHDVASYPIKVMWEPTEEEPESELVVFPRGNAVPSTKILTTSRVAPFNIEAAYDTTTDLQIPGGGGWIGRATVKGAKEAGEQPTYKVKCRLNGNGLLGFEGAYWEEIEEKEETSAPMDVDSPPGEVKKKKIVRKREVPVIVGYGGLAAETVNGLRELEASMHAADKLVKDTEDRKNALEEYIYDMRSKLDERYTSYVQSADKSAFLSKLSAAEDWLYSDEGEDATKSAYTAQLDALKSVGDPIALRYTEHTDLPKAAALLREAINNYMAQTQSYFSGEERYAHLEKKDVEGVVEKVAGAQKWLDDMMVRQAEREKFKDPVVKSSEVKRRREELVYSCNPVMSKPKPKPPVDSVPPSGTQTPQGQQESGKQTPMPGQTDVPMEDPAEHPAENTGKEKGPANMDVD